MILARSRCLDRLRGRRARAHQRSQEARLEEILESADPGPEEQVARDDLAKVVKEALLELTEPQRESIQLAFYEGLSHREVARRLDLPLGSVKTHIRKGIAKLRSLIRAYQNGLE